MTEVQSTGLLGHTVCWTGADGYKEGVIVAVSMDPRHGEFRFLILVNGTIIERIAHGVTLK